MNRYLAGLLLIILGLLFLLQHMGVLSGLSVWPATFLMMAGAMVTYHAFRGRHPNWVVLMAGLLLVAAGVTHTLHDAGIIARNGWDLLRSSWPLMLIAIGFSVLVAPRTTDAAVSSSLVGDQHHGQGGPWNLDGDLEFRSAIGDMRIDLTQAAITPGAHTIRLNQVVGDATILVPDTVDVSVDARIAVGEVAVFGEVASGFGRRMQRSYEVEGAEATLVIEAEQTIGSIEVRRVAAPRHL